MIANPAIVCLANSRKPGGMCFAGRVFEDRIVGEWIRPVSDREDEAVSEREQSYQHGGGPVLLDIVDVTLKRAVPKPNQPENWLLDPEYWWEKRGRITWGDLAAFASRPDALWYVGSHTSGGFNDRVPLSKAQGVDASLHLLHINELRVRVFRHATSFGSKRRVQGRFAYGGVDFALWITDPVVEAHFLSGADGEFAVGECYITVSLGDDHHGYCYKLIAAVITPKRAGRG